jgi:hypothetical protein
MNSPTLRLLAVLAGLVAPLLSCATRQGASEVRVQTKPVALKQPAESLTPAQRHAQAFYGLNGSKIFHIPESIDGLVQQRFSWMHDLGVGWDRIDLWWGTVEPQRGTWNFDWPDRVFDEFERQGVQWYPILCYGSAWWDGRTGPQNDEEFAQFAEYVRRTVGRYKGRAPVWSLWNEPNIPTFWSPEPNADHYAELVKQSYRALKQADPEARMAAMVLAPLGAWDRKFTERAYQQGIRDHFDIFDYHYYRSHPPEREVPAEIAEIRAVMARYGDDKPIWISESGVSTISVGEERQAAYIVRNHLLALALGIERFFYFDLQNWYDDRPHEWDSELGLVTAAGKPKPSYHAYRTLVAQTEHMDVVGRCTGLGEEIEGVLLRDPATHVFRLAVWQTKDHATRTVEIACDARGVRIVPTMGTPHELPDAQAPRVVTLDVTMHPVFVHAVDPMVYLPLAGVELAPAHTILAVGESAPLAVEVHPFLENPRVRVLSSSRPVGIQWDAANGIVHGPSARLLSNVVLTGRKTIEAELEIEHGPSDDRRTTRVRRSAVLEIVPRLTLTLRPWLEEGRLVAGVRVENRTATPVGGPLRLMQVRDGRAEVLHELPGVQLAAHEVRTFDLPVAAATLEHLNGVVHWQAEFGGAASKLFGVVPSRFSETGPVVDGVLDEWGDLPAMANNRVEQLTRSSGVWTPEVVSAGGRAWFTPTTLYFAADIVDKDPMRNDNTPHQMWRGDAVELYVGFGGPSRRTIMDKSVEFQLGFAARTKETGPVAFWFHEDVVLEAAQVAVRRTERGYALEASVPLEALRLGDMRLREGMLLALDYSVNDIDEGDWAPAGNLPGRAILWNGTSMNWIDPSGWGMTVLRRME